MPLLLPIIKIMINNLKHSLGRHLTNSLGWRTNNRIVVIESDDWGSVRMPSFEVYKKLLKAGYPVDNDPYEKFDALASNHDLECLFELLLSFTDQNGNHPSITANCVVANPDFMKIIDNNFTSYYYELFTETLKKYPLHNRVWDYWQEGIGKGIFLPQFHAREHLNVPIILEELQNRNEYLLQGFLLGYLGGLRKEGKQPKNLYVKASYFRNQIEKQQVLEAFTEGCRIFKNIFGFTSESFIPTNYMWCPDFDVYMKHEGVLINQGRHFMYEPLGNYGKKVHKRVLGRKNKEGQISLVRNARFEPSLVLNKEGELDKCLKEIAIGFKWGKPAIISIHRLNFVGFINSRNRDENLRLFERLITEILKRWPDVQFMNSVSLGKTIIKYS